jgi:uncharacterized protein (DUF2342 family)
VKLWDVIKTVGSGIIREVVPGGGILVDAVNEFLPDDKKLPGNATGGDVNNALQSLPPADQARLLDKEFDVDLAQIRQSNETVRAMLEADARNPQSTRPRIALGAFRVVAFAVVVAVSAWGYGVFKSGDPLAAASASWPFILSVIGPFVILLHAYFGVLRSEQKNRLEAASGRTGATGLVGAISGLIKRG